MSNDPTATRVHKFFVDAQQFETTETALSGLQIKEKASVTLTYQLFLEEEGDTPDRAIADTEYISMEGKEKHFFAVPPAVFGNDPRR